MPSIFAEIVRRGGVSTEEAFRVFNLGIGMAAVIAPTHGDAFTAAVRAQGGEAYRIGEITAGDGMIRIEGADARFFGT